jgi:hypothetical protein
VRGPSGIENLAASQGKIVNIARMEEGKHATMVAKSKKKPD